MLQTNALLNTTKKTEIETPTIDQILMHLDKLRHNTDCLNFILSDIIQQSLQNVYKNFCNEDLKRRYADLFTLIDEFEDFKSSQEELAKRKSPLTKKTNNITNSNHKVQTQHKRMKTKIQSKKSEQNSSSDSDIDTHDSNRQPPRKKHKTIVNDDDNC
jgi:hypothetical protein